MKCASTRLATFPDAVLPDDHADARPFLTVPTNAIFTDSEYLIVPVSHRSLAIQDRFSGIVGENRGAIEEKKEKSEREREILSICARLATRIDSTSMFNIGNDRQSEETRLCAQDFNVLES